MRVAKEMVKLVQRPKVSAMVGGAAPALRLAQFLSPALTRSITGHIMSAYFKHADSSPSTNGNLFEPAEYGTSIYGGWNSPSDIAINKKRVTIVAMISIATVAGIYIFSKRNKVR